MVTNSVVPIANPPMASAMTASRKCAARVALEVSTAVTGLLTGTIVLADRFDDLFLSDLRREVRPGRLDPDQTVVGHVHVEPRIAGPQAAQGEGAERRAGAHRVPDHLPAVGSIRTPLTATRAASGAAAAQPCGRQAAGYADGSARSAAESPPNSSGSRYPKPSAARNRPLDQRGRLVAVARRGQSADHDGGVVRPDRPAVVAQQPGVARRVGRAMVRRPKPPSIPAGQQASPRPLGLLAASSSPVPSRCPMLRSAVDRPPVAVQGDGRVAALSGSPPRRRFAEPLARRSAAQCRQRSRTGRPKAVEQRGAGHRRLVGVALHLAQRDRRPSASRAVAPLHRVAGVLPALVGQRRGRARSTYSRKPSPSESPCSVIQASARSACGEQRLDLGRPACPSARRRAAGRPTAAWRRPCRSRPAAA